MLRDGLPISRKSGRLFLTSSLFFFVQCFLFGARPDSMDARNFMQNLCRLWYFLVAFPLEVVFMVSIKLIVILDRESIKYNQAFRGISFCIVVILIIFTKSKMKWATTIRDVCFDYVFALAKKKRKERKKNIIFASTESSARIKLLKSKQS